MSRLRVALFAMVLASCGAPEPESVWLRLDRAGSCWIGGELAPVPLDGGSAIQQADARPLEFLVELPPEASLRFETHNAEPLAPAFVSVGSEEAPPVPLELARTSRGLEGDLSAYGGQLVRIRLENPGGVPRVWVSLRIASDAPPQAAEVAWSGTTPKRPNVLLYVVDALRPDRMSAYGYELPTTPRLEEYLERGTVFTNAYSVGPSTIETIPTLLTSMLRTEIDGRLRSGPDAAGRTVAEVFSDAGYETVAFQANFRLRKSLGFKRGFDSYRLVTEPSVPWFPRANAQKLHGEVVGWLEQPREKPFFLYVHSLDVHHPYAPPEPFRGRFTAHHRVVTAEEMLETLPESVLEMGEAEQSVYKKVVPTLKPHHYDDAIAYADHTLGELFDVLADMGRLDDTVILLTADHGESLGEGGRYVHGLSLNEELVRVPLLIWLPGQRERRQVDRVVSHIDVAPTLADAAGVALPDAFRGRSLLRELRGSSFALGEMGFNRFFARGGPWKILRDDDGTTLHHLDRDPAEGRDLAGEHPLRAQYLTQVLWERSVGYRNVGAPARALDAHIEGEERKHLDEALRALGYIE